MIHLVTFFFFLSWNSSDVNIAIELSWYHLFGWSWLIVSHLISALCCKQYWIEFCFVWQYLTKESWVCLELSDGCTDFSHLGWVSLYSFLCVSHPGQPEARSLGLLPDYPVEVGRGRTQWPGPSSACSDALAFWCSGASQTWTGALMRAVPAPKTAASQPMQN